MARMKQTARKSYSGKAPRKSHASKKELEIDNLTSSQVLERLHAFDEYKDMTDYAIKMQIAKDDTSGSTSKLATVEMLRNRLRALSSPVEEKIEEKQEKS